MSKNKTSKLVLTAILIFFIVPQVILAFFCPYCGTENDDSFLFCVSCGKNLTRAKSINNNESTQPKVESSTEPSKEGEENKVSEMLKSMMNSVNTSKTDKKKSFASKEADFLENQGMGNMLSNPDPAQAQELLDSLNSNPNAMRLFERYKDSSYQKNLLNGLKQVGDDDNPEMQKNIQMLEGLFDMLNNISE